MTRTTVNASTVLGANYEIITLESNNYNPQIDDDIILTCTVTDVYGDPVANKSVTLYQDGTSEGTETTDNTGAATWTITPEDWEVHHFNVENATLNLGADGWKTLLNDGTYNIRVKRDTVQLAINSDVSTSFPTTFTAFSGGSKVASGYRPANSVVVPCKSNYNLLVAVRPDGTVERKTMASSSQSAGVYCMAEWTI